ncbi:MAG: hypothetical protein HBSAPP02_09400 [Phycisphaerae bacterium]|nr:MAG: PDZ domain-containing protein [Planctomycetia bacterium]RIK69673.1 MAG: hypothetical protein DCC66_07890 [Planctomycetota bacterium]GJQ25908.1 MAG: hypothetical protein HBSAPP02_09400 [Phycisphaerae bacterium]
MRSIRWLAVLCCAAIASSSALAAIEEPAAQPAKVECQAVASVRIVAGDENCDPVVLEAFGDGDGTWVTEDGDHLTLAFVGAGDPTDANGGQKLVQKLRIAGDPDDPTSQPKVLAFVGNDDSGLKAGGPWLGVQFSPLPKPLAAQLKIESGIGLMISNVYEGSPADAAGLQQYDVITAVDGQKVTNNIGEFLEKVKVFQPGEAHAFSVVRGGQPITANITIGTRPAMDQMPKAKYEPDGEEMVGGNVFGRGGMLQKDATGNWTFKGFNLPDVPDVMKMIPDVSDLDFKFNLAVPGPGSHQVYVGKSQGKSIRVEKQNDGPFTVTTTETVNGNTNSTTKTYATEEELKAGDPEAHKLLQNGPSVHFFGKPLDGNKFEWRFDGDFMKNHEEAMKRVEETMKKLHENQGGVFGFAPGAHAGVILQRAKTSFETLPDGKLRVTLRSGEDELVDVYENADALKAARPELYEKYQSLQSQK